MIQLLLQIGSILLLILSITALEVVLSIDNATVLGVIVNRDLPVEQRKKALRYGMWGAFVFRGLALFAVGLLLNSPVVGIIFKILGGLYLLRLGYKGLTPKVDSTEEGDVSWYEKLFKRIGLNTFWTTVLVCEAVDIIFSLDNLVAVVGMSSNIWIVIFAVIIGIFIMRIVSTKFSQILDKYPFLEKAAFTVVLLLGLKLVWLGASQYCLPSVYHVMNNHIFDFAFSGVMMLIFFIPFLVPKIKRGVIVPMGRRDTYFKLPKAFFNTQTAETAYYNEEMGFYYTKEDPSVPHSLWGLQRTSQWKELN